MSRPPEDYPDRPEPIRSADDAGEEKLFIDAQGVTRQVSNPVENVRAGDPSKMVVWRREKGAHRQGDYFTTMVPAPGHEAHPILPENQQLLFHTIGRTYTFQRGVPLRVHEEDVAFLLAYGTMLFELVGE